MSKVAVITGASRGLGRAMAEEFMRSGWVVAGCSRSAAGGFDAPHLYRALDVRDAQAVGEFAQWIEKEAGIPDLLINNAAIINRSAPVWELTPEEFGDIVDINLKGVFNAIRAFVPAMVRRNRGTIVNFSSGWGRSASPEVASYCATKFAIEGLTQALAQELPGGMAAVPLNPGVIDTDMLRSCFGGSAESYPKPRDWAKRAVQFIAGLRPKDSGQSLSVP